MDSEGAARSFREVLDVLGDDVLSAGYDHGGQHVAIVRVCGHA